MKISTAKLQSMMSKVVKGVGNNKLIPITCLIGIEAKNKVITITSTDGTNYLYVRSNIDSEEEFYVCIKVDQFAKLVSKTTSEFISLEIRDNSLEVRGNGKYQIEIPLDETGDIIKYPNPLAEIKESVWIGKFTQSQIGTILNTVKTAIASDISSYPYNNYFVGNTVLATDRDVVCSYAEKILTMPKIINPNMMDLLSVVSADEVDVKQYENKIIFDTEDVTIYGVEVDDISVFMIDLLNNLVSQNFPYSCKVNKGAMLQLLDRMSLFVGAYDDGAISLTFGKDGISVKSKQTDGEEIVEYVEPVDISEPYTLFIDINKLQSQIKAQSLETITVQFGDGKAIKIVADNITSVIALIVNK